MIFNNELYYYFVFEIIILDYYVNYINFLYRFWKKNNDIIYILYNFNYYWLDFLLYLIVIY